MRRIVVLAVGLLVLGAVPAQADPVVKARMCSDGARMRLELINTRARIKVRFEVHQIPPGHEWRIAFRHVSHNITPSYGHVFFRGTRVASDSGVFEVRVRRPDFGDGVVGKAVDTRTGQVGKVRAWYR